MKIEYFHASKFGNGAMVAREFKKRMETGRAVVNVHHVKDMKHREIAPADLYVFSTPGRFGKPIGDMRHFLERAELPRGKRCAVLSTEPAPRPDRKTGRMPDEGEQDRWQRVIPIMNEMLQKRGMVKVAEGRIFVMGLKGPLEEGWQKKVDAFATLVCPSLVS